MKQIIGWIIGIAVGWLIFNAIRGFGKYEGLSAEEWFNQYDEESAQVEELNTKVDDLKTALQEANNNIEEVNSNIETAKRSKGGTYEDMDSALYRLDTTNTVDEP